MASTHISQSHRSGACCCRILPLILAVLCAIGIAATWLLFEPSYTVSGAIRVAPVVSNIITGQDDRGGISDYTGFMTTQAMMITSSQVVENVANDLSGKGLRFFEERSNTLAAKFARKFGRKEITPEPEKVLKEAILDGVITAEAAQRGEVILVSMKWHNTAEAMRIVDSFIRNYMSLEVTSASNREERNLAILQNEQKLLYSKLEGDRVQISSMAKEYGSKKLDERYDMNLKRIAMLLSTLTEVEAKRILLEIRVKLLERSGGDGMAPKNLVLMRQEYVLREPAVGLMTKNILDLEQEIIDLRRKSPDANPEIESKTELVKELNKRLEDYKTRASETFDKMIKEQTMASAVAELEQTQAHEDKLRGLLAKEDQQTIDLGHKNLAMQALQDELTLTKEMYDRISRRIQEFKMERKRPARISIAYRADITETHDIRGHCTVALSIGFVVFGILSLILRRKRPG